MKYLITSALPYANGPLHFGHLAGAYLPADVYARHRKLQGNEVLFISGSDEHGVAITLKAKQENCDYKKYVDRWHQSHKELFKKYQIEFDFFGQTSADYHEPEAVKWFSNLYEKGFIEPRDSQQLFCNGCQSHLADRFVEGICYVCDFDQARGDECPNCGEWIEAIKLKSPKCKMCGSTDISEITVTQYYLLLSKYQKEFKNWFATKKHWRKTVVPYVESLIEEGLVDRAITRDLDWGIDVPLEEAKGKKLYVWFDAPIGYVSNTKRFLQEAGRDEDYLKDWWHNNETQIEHFIGKDNIIFHCLIFPIMGMASGIINPPNNVPANQYLNLEGKQFSKSTGWYVDADDALEKFGADALRYYLISLIPESTDSSFSWQQFAARVNNELANNIGNFINRCLKFMNKNWPEGLEAEKFLGFSSSEHGKSFSKGLQEHQELLDQVLVKRGLEKMMSLGQEANTFFSDRAPWAEFKKDPQQAAGTIAWSCQYLMALAVAMAPYLPGLSQNILEHFDLEFTDTTKRKLYCGDLAILDELLASGLKLKKVPDALVPKIDSKIIDDLVDQLQSKVEGVQG